MRREKLGLSGCEGGAPLLGVAMNNGKASLGPPPPPAGPDGNWGWEERPNWGSAAAAEYSTL